MQLPDIRQLRIFVALEETRSFTAAAKHCFVTQSAVSHSIKSLEKQLDCQLIERMGKRIILTPYGEVFHHHAKRVISELELSLGKLEKIKQWGFSSLTVAVPDSICELVLPQVLDAFYDKHPKCDVSVRISDTQGATRMVAVGDADLAIGIRPAVQDPKFVFTPLIKDELCFITNTEHPWAKSKNFDSADLTGTRLFSYAEESETQRLLQRYFTQNLIKHHQPVCLGNMAAIKQMTKLGIGVGIIPNWLVKKEVSTGELIKHPISSEPPERQWGVFSSAQKTHSLPQEVFISLIKEQMGKTITA